VIPVLQDFLKQMTIYYVFFGPKIQNFMQTQISDDSPLESEFLSKSLDSAQERVEERSTTKNLFDYDDVLNKQRNIVYHEEDKFWSVLIQKNILRMVNKLSQKFY
jgi:preprotein translocase subunit SecA